MTAVPVGDVGLIIVVDVSWLMGTWMAMLWTFTPAVELTPAAIWPSPVLARPKVVWSCSKGRRSPRSKMAPRST